MGQAKEAIKHSFIGFDNRTGLMLQIKNLTISHRKDLRYIIQDFSFVLNDGDKAVIIGEEANGKSTLLKIIYNPEIVSGYVEYEGEIIKQNQRIGYLSQELTDRQKRMSILEFCSETNSFYDLLPNDLAKIASQLELKQDLFHSDELLSRLSGGEKVKLQMARILMEKPEVLLLDEPSNDVDIDMLKWLENFINKCQIPILFVSHDETLIENTANVIIHLEQINRKTIPKYTIAKMGYPQYVKERFDRLSHQEQVARKERSEYEKQQQKFMQIQQKVEHQQNIITRQNPSGGRLLKKKMHAIKSMEKRFEKAYETMTEIPETEDAIFLKLEVNEKIPNGKTVIDLHIEQLIAGTKKLTENISLHVTGPEKICIIGKNGTGKTTLLKHIKDQLLNRKDINAGYMSQEYEDMLDFTITPVEFLSEIGDHNENSRIRTYLGSMKYTSDEMNHKISELSGGQKAKLLILKMSLNHCNVLILDEPTRNFSPLSGSVIRELLQNFEGAIISVSHDRKYLKEVCTVIYKLSSEGLVRVEEI